MVLGKFQKLQEDLISWLQCMQESLNDMHKVVSEKIGKIEGILGSESFIEMKRRTKPMPYMPRVNA